MESEENEETMHHLDELALYIDQGEGDPRGTSSKYRTIHLL